MTLELRNFTGKLSSLGKKIIHTDIKGEHAWDDMLVLVSQLEVECRKFRSHIDKQREKDAEKHK